MKNIKTAICISAAILLAVSGCSSDSARRIEAGGARSLLSVNKINMADWNEAASSLVNDMLASGAQGIHLYVMNNPYVARRIAESIKPILAELNGG